MSEEVDSISRLASQTENLGYYAGLTFGVGYCLTLIGGIAVIVELILKGSSIMPSGYWSYIGSQIPPWFIASMVFFVLSLICAIYFAVTIIRNSKLIKASGLTINAIASSVSAFSFMLVFMWLGITIIMAAARLSLFSPICGVVGSILLLIGFKTYRSSESKVIGAILLIVSIALIYLVAYRGGLLGLLGMGVGMLGFPLPGPLYSELTLELTALLIATVGAVIFAFPTLSKELKRSITTMILSVSGILFSVGVMYFNFSAVSAIDKFSQLLSSLGWIPGFPRLTIDSIWIVFFGFLLLGISGIIALITACLPLAMSAKQLSTTLGARPKAPEVIPAKPVEEVKYCSKCGASMSQDAIYCPKCGQKQP